MRHIKHAVGNFMDNEEGDVFKVKEALNEIGVRDGLLDNGIIERETDTAIKKFQKERTLKIDGILLPGGETEEALRQEVFKRRILQVAADQASKGNKFRKKVGRFGTFAREASENARKRREEEDRRRQELLDNEDSNYAGELAKQKSEHISNTLEDMQDAFLKAFGLDRFIEGGDQGKEKR